MASEKQEQSVVEVPQGTFAEITPGTDLDIIGMFTTGMGPCCHVLVTNTSNGHSILCHADAQTDLRDTTYGLPAWIDRVCPGKDYTHLNVSIGETAAKERGGAYYDATTEVLSAKLGVPKEKIGDKLVATNGFNDAPGEGWSQYGIEVNRAGKCKSIHHDNMIAGIEYEEKGIEVQGTDVDINGLREVLGADEMMPPLCAFDGKRFLSEKEVISQQPEILGRPRSDSSTPPAPPLLSTMPLDELEAAREAAIPMTGFSGAMQNSSAIKPPSPGVGSTSKDKDRDGGIV